MYATLKFNLHVLMLMLHVWYALSLGVIHISTYIYTSPYSHPICVSTLLRKCSHTSTLLNHHDQVAQYKFKYITITFQVSNYALVSKINAYSFFILYDLRDRGLSYVLVLNFSLYKCVCY